MYLLVLIARQYMHIVRVHAYCSKYYTGIKSSVLQLIVIRAENFLDAKKGRKKGS